MRNPWGRQEAEMVKVRCGKPEHVGVVNMSFKQYKEHMAKNGGNDYVTVYLDTGEARDWRVKYLREVEE